MVTPQQLLLIILVLFSWNKNMKLISTDREVVQGRLNKIFLNWKKKKTTTTTTERKADYGGKFHMTGAVG